MADLDYTIPDEERKRNFLIALGSWGSGLLGAQKGREAEAFGRAGQNFFATNEALNRGWQDQQQERMKSQMMQMQMDAYRQQQADAAEQRRLQEGLGPLMAGMPTLGQGAAPPQAGVAPRTAANFGSGPVDSLDATTMPPAPRTQAAAGPYEAFLAKAQYLEEQAQRNPRMAPQLMKLAESYLTQAEKWRSKNYGSLQAVRGPDGRPVMAQQQEYGAPQTTGFQPPPDLQASNGGDRQIIWDKSGVAPMPDMAIRQSADNAASVGATIRGQNMVDARSREANAAARGPKPQWDASSGQFVLAPTGMAPGSAAAPAGFSKPDKPLTESQAKATAYVNQMEGANRVFSELSAGGFTGESSGQQGSLAAANAEGIPFVPGSAAIPRAFAGAAAQKYQQAELMWTEALLRFMTGANAPEAEVRRNADTYFPRPGDSREKVQQKEYARAVAEQSIRLAAGDAGNRAQAAVAPPARTAPTVSDLEKELKRRGIAL